MKNDFPKEIDNLINLFKGDNKNTQLAQELDFYKTLPIFGQIKVSWNLSDDEVKTFKDSLHTHLIKKRRRIKRFTKSLLERKLWTTEKKSVLSQIIIREITDTKYLLEAKIQDKKYGQWPVFQDSFSLWIGNYTDSKSEVEELFIKVKSAFDMLKSMIVYRLHNETI